MDFARVRDLALFVFRPEQAESMLDKVGYRVRQGAGFVTDGRRAHFFCCDRPVSVERIGRVMPGSFELICDDPLCLDRYIAASVSE